MKLIYIWSYTSNTPIEITVSNMIANTIAHKLEDVRFDFVNFDGLVLPKKDIEQVKFTEVSN